eukprot:gnl/TRDRNA2_/TRDRNA2_40592_c1_seq1.p1 gnl/TRDRNA2_/TRDRNA2_40592_c1~~gnl/TRDRNA2_/TRDRNA2_40592_c1_seq1.p1  ORF type:complete len:377 (+),score=49.97 gnl/TRDRNA2_/TRDRNA2_40592_c1_seq1:62-1192(+)
MHRRLLAISICTVLLQPQAATFSADHPCSKGIVSDLLDLLPGVKDVRYTPPYLDLANGELVHECPPWSDVLNHVLLFKWLYPLVGDGWLFQQVLVAVNSKYQSWDETFAQQGQDPKTEVLNFCKEWGVQLKPYVWNKLPEQFTTANDFFTRSYSPKYAPENNLAQAMIVSPSDSIVTWFTSAASLPEKLKNDAWTLEEVGVPDHESYLPFPAAIFYLAPYDYHCYHSPIAGKLTKVQLLDQDRYSVTVKSYIFKTVNILRRNRRAVIVVQSDEDPTLSVAMVVVGGVTVDSIRLDPSTKTNATVKKGQHLGCFARGGSTIALLFNRHVTVESPQPAKAIQQHLNFRIKAGGALGKSSQGSIQELDLTLGDSTDNIV